MPKAPRKPEETAPKPIEELTHAELLKQALGDQFADLRKAIENFDFPKGQLLLKDLLE